MPPLLALALLLALSLPSEASIDAAGDGAAPVFAAQMPGELPPLPPRFLPASADDPLDLWQRRVAEARQAMPAYAPRNGGRGIVMTTGRRTYFTAAAVTVRIIREHLGSTLPIELFFGGAEELPPAAVVYFENTWPDVRVVDAAALVAQLDASGHEPLDVKGYQIKALSIYLSAFDEVLWLDADDMPLSDPAGLFESELYKKHGAVFWPGKRCRAGWAMMDLCAAHRTLLCSQTSAT